MTTPKQFYTLSVDPDLWHKLKILCAMEGVTLREKIEQLIIQELKKPSK